MYKPRIIQAYYHYKHSTHPHKIGRTAPFKDNRHNTHINSLERI